MMRDKLADEVYFSTLIKKWDQKVRVKKRDLDETISLHGSQASMLCSRIVADQMRMASAAYSRGDAISEVSVRVSRGLEDLAYQHRILRNYPNAIRGGASYYKKFLYLSWSIAFDVPENAKNRVLDHFSHYGTDNDPVLDAMLDHLKGKPIRQIRDRADLSYTDNVVLLWDAIELGAEGGEVPMRKYLEGWYAANARSVDAGLGLGIGAHEKMIRYIGYWCWEAAALVLMLDLDDSGFQDHEHYPRDLVIALR